MNTKKGFKAEIYWKNNCKDEFFLRMLGKCSEKYGVLIVKGWNSPINVLCIFKRVGEDKIFVQTIPSLNKACFSIRKVLGFALLEQKEIRVIIPKDVKLPKNWGKVR